VLNKTPGLWKPIIWNSRREAYSEKETDLQEAPISSEAKARALTGKETSYQPSCVLKGNLYKTEVDWRLEDIAIKLNQPANLTDSGAEISIQDLKHASARHKEPVKYINIIF